MYQTYKIKRYLKKNMFFAINIKSPVRIALRRRSRWQNIRVNCKRPDLALHTQQRHWWQGRQYSHLVVQDIGQASQSGMKLSVA